MILSRLDLKAFGRFTDVSIDLSAGPKRFHLIYGPNESGKSTSLRAITSLLYGMPQAAEDCFVHRTDKIRVGGCLLDPVTGVTLECVRRRGRKGTLRDATDKEPIDESQLEAMLGGVNRDTFLTRFGLSYDALVEGGAAILSGNGDLGQILFAAGAGVGRLREIQSELEESAALLFLPRGSKSSINTALKQLDVDRKDLREAQVSTASFLLLREQLDAKQRQAASLDGELRECLVLLTRMRSLQEALPLLPSWFAAEESFEKVADAPGLDDNFTERRRKVTSEREIAISQQKELDARITKLTKQLASLGSDPVVMQHELEIQKAFQEIAAREKADRDRLDLVRSQRSLEEEIKDLLGHLSVEIQEGEPFATSEAISQSIARLQINDALRSRIRELAAEHAGLVARRNDASDLVETTKRRLADAMQELESVGAVGDPILLGSLIESIGNPEAEMDSLLSSRQNCDTLRRRCESTLQRLEGFEGNLEQAISLQLPSSTSVAQLVKSLRDSLHDVTKQESLVRELQQDREAIQHQLLDSQAERRLPTLLELQSARDQRDLIVKRLADAVVSGQMSLSDIEELRAQVRDSDTLADTIREHFEQIHRRETLASQLEVMDTKIRDAKQAVELAHANYDSTRRDWVLAWQSCRVSAGQPEQMQQWLTHHEKLCDLMKQLEGEEKTLEKIQSRITRATKRLRNALDSVHAERPVRTASSFQAELFDDPMDDDLVSVYDEAVVLRNQWTRDRQQYDAIRRKKDELVEELPQAETRFEAAQKALENWHKEWRQSTESFVEADRAGTAEVLMMLDQISQLNNLKRERDSIVAQLQAIDEDDRIYASQVEELAKAIAHQPGKQQSPTAVAHTMYQRLQSERSASRGREALLEELELSQKRLLSAKSQRAESDAVLGHLCSEAGCESPDKLPEIECRAKERSKLQHTLRELKSQLLRLAGDQPLDEFLALAADQQPAVLAVDIERTEEKQAELKQQIETVHREIGATQNELKRIDGGSKASDLVQSMQLTAGLLRTEIESYARLKVGAMLLSRAIEHYRQQNQSPVLVLANQYFRQLTCGEYLELRPDFDASGASILFGVNATGDQVPVSGMSTGTADSLYLALRLASLEHQMKDGKAIPLIIDDCLIQLDDARAAAALKVFSDLSEKTQVILFTHHQHLCQLAQESLGAADFHLHQIGI